MLKPQTKYSFQAKLWLYNGQSSWHFYSLPVTISKKIKSDYNGLTNGFGSLKVMVTINKISWKTSIFPDSKSGSFLLPVKAEVRKKANLTLEAKVKIDLKILTSF